jgi:hypothetical protein
MSKLHLPTGIKWSTADAPQPISGVCENFTYKDATQVYEFMGEADLAAIVLHGRKGDISFSSTPAGSVAALAVRAGGAVTISGLSTGALVVTQASARWQRGQAMTMEAQVSHYPDATGTAAGSITPASITLAYGGSLELPTGTIWWGTKGVPSPTGDGIVQSCSISESVQTQEEEDEDGKIVMVVAFGYKATASIEVITGAAKPAIGDTMDAFGGFLITSSEERWAKQGMRLVSCDGLLIPGVTE